MIEIKNLEINAKRRNNYPINILFPIGIFYLDSTNKKIFNFLLFDKQVDVFKGQFLVDEVDVFSSEEFSHFSLKINSKFGCFYSFFLIDKKERDSQSKDIIDSFSKLKELPHDNEEQISIKIKALFDLFINKKAKYICIDFNEENNKENENIIIDMMTHYQEQLTFICLKRKVVKQEAVEQETVSQPVEQEIPSSLTSEDEHLENVKESTSLNFKGIENNVEIVDEKENSLLQFDSFEIGKNSEVDKVAEQNKKKKKNNKDLINSTKKYLNLIKSNFLVSVLIAFASVLVVLFSMLSIYSFNHNKLFDSILILLVILISFSVCSFIQVSSFDFLNGKKIKTQKQKYLFTIIFVEISTLLGIAVGYGLFALFYNIDFLLKKENYIFDYSIVAIILTVVILIVPFFSPLILKLIKKIKLFFAPVKNKR